MSGRYRSDPYGGGGDHYGRGHRGGGYYPMDRRGGGPPPPQQQRYPPPHHHNNNRGPPPPRSFHGGYRGGHRGGGPQRGQAPRRMKPGPITFKSYEEERAWVEERRRKRKERPTKFDQMMGGDDDGMHHASNSMMMGEPQQTRHARRLYVGNLPPGVTEEQIHSSFRNAVKETMEVETTKDTKKNDNEDEDPILTVYINYERNFSFIEFKSVEICSACMALDGLEIVPGCPVKVKRPNDYNPATAPCTTTSAPTLNVSKLGIVSPTVLDGPHKVFIGGLHYHFTEQQVMEMLSAFGKLKAFHLVKTDPESPLSKGYCFVEFVDPAVTPVAVKGLNEMELGQGKKLTARVAGAREGATTTGSFGGENRNDPDAPTAPPLDRTIVEGYDIDQLVDAALGHRNMPHGPTYIDPATGIPITRIAGGAAVAPPPLPPPPPSILESRILVLLHMVTEEDLRTAEDHQALVEEVTSECAKYGELRSVTIPREAMPPAIQPSAVRKVFLEYAATPMAIAARKELDGRTFGDASVATEFLSEADFQAGRYH